MEEILPRVSEHQLREGRPRHPLLAAVRTRLLRAAQARHFSPEVYRQIELFISDDTIHFNGEATVLDPANSEKAARQSPSCGARCLPNCQVPSARFRIGSPTWTGAATRSSPSSVRSRTGGPGLSPVQCASWSATVPIPWQLPKCRLTSAPETPASRPQTSLLQQLAPGTRVVCRMHIRTVRLVRRIRQ